ncbi:MAG: type IV secretion system DNA-binding domain-containing protein [Candidatus Gracilibacteria bacterium]|nr:type IV secretion system DNA-binding domain-containing protein [Candidatus Gracilibacteria bacterium]
MMEWFQHVDWSEFLRSLWSWKTVYVGIGLILAWWVLKLLIFWARIWHQVHGFKKYVQLRVTLPRNDSKLDNEKRTEKDFHEAVSKGEQFFRAIHETRDLNLYNIALRRIPWAEPHISFELQFRDRQMDFVVVCHPYYRPLIEKQITTFYESAEIHSMTPEQQLKFDLQKEHVNGYNLYTAEPYWYPIQTYKKIEDDSLNGLANSFAQLQPDEKAVIQFVVHPRGDGWKKKASEAANKKFKREKKSGLRVPILGPILRGIWFPIKILIRGYDPAVDGGGTNAPGAKSGDSYIRMLQSEEDVAKSMGEKALQSGFHTTVRVMASSPRENRVSPILNGMFVAFNIFKGKGTNRFEYKRIVPFNSINHKLILWRFRYRLRDVFEKHSTLCSEELATMFHFPDARYNRIPTIKWLTYKILPPPINLPEEGVVLGKSVYRGVEKQVHFLKEDRTRHQYIIGKSGSGKSVLLWNQAIQDIANGEGVCVVDPHGDLIDDVASCVPKERAKDTIIFDPSDKGRPMGLNILETKNDDEQDRASLDAMEIMIKLFGNEIFGPRIQHYFRNGCLTLMSDKGEGATLIDVPRLFIDDDFQRYKVAKVRNPVVRSFWENEMANTGQREKQEMIPYFTSKFGPFVTNTTMRNVIGQTKSAFDVRDCMDNKKVLLINLSKGKIGGINAQLLGLVVVSKINMAAMGRADIPQKERKDFYLYVDEFQNFATDTFATILSEARKYRLNLIMAHQYIAQLSESAAGISIGQKDSKIRDAVFGNVGTMVSFKVGAEDAEYLEKEYAPLLSAQDILSIANYKTYIKLNIENTTSRVFSMETLYDPSLKNDKVLEVLKKYSRMKYGRKKEFVDAEIEARMGIDNLGAIEKTAKDDPTVNDNLLGDTPIPTKIKEEEISATTGTLQDQVENPGAGAVFDPKKIPENVKKAAPTEALLDTEPEKKST